MLWPNQNSTIQGNHMNRRQLCQAIALSLSAASLEAVLPTRAEAALPATRITKVSIFNPSDESGLSGWINQSAMLVKIETDNGMFGIGQGGARDLFDDLAGMLIGENPFRIEYLWSRLYRNKFYTPGREKLHAIGALDCALWDLKAKAMDVPLYELLGGRTRSHIECYQSYGTLSVANARDSARATMDAGFRAVRFHGIDYDANGTLDMRRAVAETARVCEQMRLGVGDDGDWLIDLHTRFELTDALRLIERIAQYDPFFVEDPLRNIVDTNLFRQLRQHTSVPLAAGEQFGDVMDGIRPLVEENLIDWLRCSMPNVGGITPFKKIAALCEAHSVGLVPHFTAPLATAAVAHALFSCSGKIINEMNRTAVPDYVVEGFDLRDGKLWPVERPGIGVAVDESKLNLVAVIDRARDDGLYRGLPYHQDDGSYLYL
jgi:galactonate dehydratase